ncbi:hypothetical protein PHSY_003413 [Pseudozyma hubeiensis SY62]|uniref:Uncharacterized protein n=1 Tax=Pseudozyma hubeiensis (strain SY62) TaxID=1305764 RepID=R9P3C7_PSEHS|nr:hypothetical protein PHSY_003413 [Pseudozyma hubeiensis SY62]GAC95836.1 hypothetical protein PHSY_003413 [Pseudozyma hubeiensis SY62]
MPPPSKGTSDGASDDHHKRTSPAPPRPSSLSLRAPRSASVQQLVSRWEAQPDPSSSTSLTSSKSAAPPPISSALTSTSTDFGPAPAHRALLANAVNATNGTLGPLDWTPKYGLPSDPPRPPALRVTTKPSVPASPRSPSRPKPFSDSNKVSPANPHQRRHLVPLRSVQPAQTIPSPVSPSPDSALPSRAERPPASPSAFSPTTHDTSYTLQSTVDTIASNTPLVRSKAAPKSDPIHISEHGASLIPAALPPHTSASFHSDQHSSKAPLSASVRISQPATSNERTNLRAPREGLARPSSNAHIFDLDAKLRLGTSKYLPSSFRDNIPARAAQIPERSSSHLSAPSPATPSGQANQDWSAEDPSSIPLLPATSTQELPLISSSVRAQATLWKDLVSNEIAQGAVCSLVDADALPVAADDVFCRDAALIHLPALEEYLRNPFVFGEPIFSDSDLVCTDQEKQLFGLDPQFMIDAASPSPQTSRIGALDTEKSNPSKSRTKSKLPQLEVAGGQINCPALLYTSSVDSPTTSNKDESLRRRRGARTSQQLPADTQPSKTKRHKHSSTSHTDEMDPLLAVATGGKKKSRDDDPDDPADDMTVVDAREDRELESDDDATLKADDALQAQKVASRISARVAESKVAGNGSALPSEGVSSKFSTLSNPVTRKHMFPPLMLLKKNNLDELKSNAIGPRRPPGGIWAIGWLGIIFDTVIGVEGSTFAAGILRLESLRDLFQIMTVQLHFQRYFDSSDPTSTTSKFFKFLLQTLPAFLGFDLVSVFGYAVIFFVVWIVITALALWRFWRMTKAHNPNKTVEGYDSQGWIYKSASRGTRFANTCLVFVLGLLYLPLSKLAVDALVWSSDFWPVPNPYKGGIDDPVPGPLLGDPDLWHAPLDFCYTTTMRKDAFNWAYVILPLAVLTIIFYTLWYPYKLMMTIKEMLPNVSKFNELGRKRSEEEMQIYYHRLLNRDKSPFNFLYNSYHRKWGYYKPLYILLFKLSNLLIIGVLAKDNCLFRSFRTRTMLVVQQGALIAVMASLLGVHLIIRPFVDKIGNRSEMVSRIGYVLTATIGLLVALNVQGSTVYNTTILYIIQGFTYGGNIYFALLGMSFVAHQVKRWQSRVDYTIDIFSPLLDITKHIKRRVWEETLSILILCGREYHMPLEQVIAFSVSDEDKWPPYLIDFQGSVAERHIENLKVVKQIGIEAYRSEVDISRTEEGVYRQKLIRTIQRDYTGPDAYWRPQEPPFPSGVMSFFGKAFMVPFPPTLVVRYDEGGDHSLTLSRVEDFEAFIQQNSDAEIVGKRMVRQALRALEGQKVLCPYVSSVQIGDPTSGLAFVDKMFGRISDRRKALPRFGRLGSGGGRSEYVLATPISYVEGTVKIERRNEFNWAGYNFDGGFEVSIVYEDGRMKETSGAITLVRRRLEVSASRVLGLTEDFDMNPTLSRFLQDNERLVIDRAPLVEKVLRKYRRHFEREALWKERVLPYSFLTDVFDNDGLSPLGLRMALVETGCGRSMRNLPMEYEGSITLMYERLAAINRSPAHRFWWIFFDEIWRLNSNDYSLLRKYRRSFSPQYPTSIAYRPMPRQDLEEFLRKRGLWKKKGAKGGPFNRGLLNRIYFSLNEIVFAGHSDARAVNPRRGWSDQHHRKGGRVSDPRKDENPFLDPVDSDLRRAATIKVGLGHDATQATRRDFSTIDDDPSHSSQLTSSSAALSPGAHHQKEERSWGLTANPSITPSQYTGGGTAYSNDSVIVRTAYRWEQRMDGYATDTPWQRFKVRSLQWLSLHPVVVKFDREKLYLYLKLVEAQGEDGKRVRRYELLKPACRPT